MFKELELFQEASSQYDDRIMQLERMRFDAKKANQEAVEVYRLMLQDDKEGATIHPLEDLSAAQRKVTETTEAIKLADERLERLKLSKRNELSQHLSEVYKGWKREDWECTQAVNDVRDETRPLVAALFDLALKAQKVRSKSFDLIQAVNAVEREMGVDFMQMLTHRKITAPETLSIVDTLELDETYRTGELPNWIRK